jgi:Homeodomain-like domain
MIFYPESAVEQTIKIQEVILRAMAKKITWCQAAEIIGISDRQMRQWYERYRRGRRRRLLIGNRDRRRRARHQKHPGAIKPNAREAASASYRGFGSLFGRRKI